MRTIFGTWGFDPIFEEAATDDLEIFAFDGNDLVFSGSGNDRLVGGKGNDQLNGGDGNDTIWGGNGPVEDRYSPDYGADRLFGGMGNDHLFGQGGNDWLEGGGGHDEINGGRGDDTILGGCGTDKMWGDEGKDRFIFSPMFQGENNQPILDSSLDQQTMDRIYDFVSGYDSIAFRGADAGVEWANYLEVDMFAGASYADVLTTASGIIASGKTYAFVADGANGYLFVDMNRDGNVDQGVMLAGLHNTSMFAASDLIGL